MSGPPRPLLLGLKFREQHSQVLVDEFDNLLASLQTQLGKLGVFTLTPPSLLSTKLANGSRWSVNTNPLYTRVGYCVFGGMLFISYHLAQTTLSANSNPWLGLPPGLRTLEDFMCQIPCLIQTASTATIVSGYAYVEARTGYSSQQQTYIAFSKADASAWSTTANDVTIDGQIIMPYQKV